MHLRKMQGWARFTEVYEWSPRRGRWYPINRRNIVLSMIPLDTQRAIFNAMLGGETIDIEAQYLKPKLSIRAVDMVYQYENRKNCDLSPANSLFSV